MIPSLLGTCIFYTFSLTSKPRLCGGFIVAWSVEEENEEENIFQILQREGLRFSICCGIHRNKRSRSCQAASLNAFYTLGFWHNLRAKRNLSKDLTRCKPGKSLTSTEIFMRSKTQRVRICFRSKRWVLKKILSFLQSGVCKNRNSFIGMRWFEVFCKVTLYYAFLGRKETEKDS